MEPVVHEDGMRSCEDARHDMLPPAPVAGAHLPIKQERGRGIKAFFSLLAVLPRSCFLRLMHAVLPKWQSLLRTVDCMMGAAPHNGAGGMNIWKVSLRY